MTGGHSGEDGTAAARRRHVAGHVLHDVRDVDDSGAVARGRQPISKLVERFERNKAYRFVKRLIEEFIDDDCAALAAALAYYTLFALPPLLVVVIGIVSALTDPTTVEGRLHDQFQALIGASGADMLRDILRSAQRESARSGALPTIVGTIALLFGASGAFGQLQAALNRAWDVRPAPGGIWVLLRRRLLSFAMIGGLAFLMLASLIASAVLAAFSAELGQLLPRAIGPTLLWVIDFSSSIFGLGLVLTLIFWFVPDAKVGFRSAAFGGVVTAILFALGKVLIGIYLGKSGVASTYGAAGALVVLLIWIYFSSMIVLFGAELTQVWAAERGHEIIPARGAERCTPRDGP